MGSIGKPGAARVGAFVAALALLVPGAASAAAGGPYYAAGPQLFALGNGSAMAFSPSGRLLATASSVLSMRSVGSDGRLSSLSSAASARVGGSDQVAFSPSGALVATVSSQGGRVSVFAVDGNGAIHPAPGSPFATARTSSGPGSIPLSVAFAPDGRFLATVDANSGVISMFAVAADGSLSQVAGSPFAAGGHPVWVAFSPAGHLLATANSDENTVATFSVADDGTLSLVQIKPIAQTSFNGDIYSARPSQVLFSPSGGLLATQNTGSISVFDVGANGTISDAPGSPHPAFFEPAGIAFAPHGDQLIQGELGDGFDSWPVTSNGQLGAATYFATVNRTYALAFGPTGLIASSNGANLIEMLTPVPPGRAALRSALTRASAVGGPQLGRWHLLANNGYNVGATFPEEVNAQQITSARLLGPGLLTITWRARQHLRKGRTKTVILARVSKRFTFQDLGFKGIPLTAAGRRLLKQETRLTVGARATFTPVGGAPIQVSQKPFTLFPCRDAECRSLVAGG